MMTLLTFRDNVKAYYSRYDYILTPIFKFLFSMLVFVSLNKQTGYWPLLSNIFVVIGLSLVCAFLPVEFLTGIAGIVFVLQCFKVSIDVMLVGLALGLIFYCGFMRFSPKSSILVFLVPIFAICHMTYCIPVLCGFLAGPVAIIPALFGVLLYNYEVNLNGLSNILTNATAGDAAASDSAITGYQYMLNALLTDKQMLLTFIVFACVILITYVIYRASFAYSWIVAFCVGAFLNVLLFLVGGLMMGVEVKIGSVLLGSLVGVLLAVIIQFWKGIVDYQRTELLQYEDDDYYYYVKAIPKMTVTESNKNVKHINSKIHN